DCARQVEENRAPDRRATPETARAAPHAGYVIAGYLDGKSLYTSHHWHVVQAPMAERPVALPPQERSWPCLIPILARRFARPIASGGGAHYPARRRCGVASVSCVADVVRTAARQRPHDDAQIPRRRTGPVLPRLSLSRCRGRPVPGSAAAPLQ